MRRVVVWCDEAVIVGVFRLHGLVASAASQCKREMKRWCMRRTTSRDIIGGFYNRQVRPAHGARLAMPPGFKVCKVCGTKLAEIE